MSIANKNWSSRSPDERFQTLNDMIEAAAKDKAQSATRDLSPAKIEFTDVNDELCILNKDTGRTANLTNFAFQQMAQFFGTSPKFLSPLKTKTVAMVLNELKDQESKPIRALFRVNEAGVTVRAIASTEYARIYDVDVLEKFRKLENNGWYNPIAMPHGEPDSVCRIATADDVGKYAGRGGNQVKVGDKIVPSGLFRSDRNMYAIMISKDGTADDGFGNPLIRALTVSNTELYGETCNLEEILLEGICLNLLFWGIRSFDQKKFRHIGNAHSRVMFSLDYAIDLATNIKPNFDSHRQMIKLARGISLGSTQDDVVENVYKARIDPVLTKKVLDQAIDTAAKFKIINGDPYRVWGVYSGLTRFSQTLPNNDDRIEIDRAAGKMLSKLVGV